MEIDSVRELKASLLEKHIHELAAVPTAGSKLSIAARSLQRLKPNPRTIALGVSPHGKKFRLAVRIQNRALEASDLLTAITKRARGEVDVRFVGRIAKRAPWYQSRQRPLAIGSSIGHFQITAGTLGCFVENLKTLEPRILSNNHVLADENRGKKGDAIIQPGDFDGGQNPKDAIGTLAAFVRLRTNKSNVVDAAVAAINSKIKWDPANLRGIGKLKGVGPAIQSTGIEVQKVGRTTGVTHGHITAFELDNVVVEYDIGNLSFDDQIEIEGTGSGPFSQGGDSGSLIVDQDVQGVALLFAGSDSGGSNGMGLTFANPIHPVLKALKIGLLTA